METTGLILQLVAGFMLALTNLVNPRWFITLNRKLNGFFQLPFKQKRRFVTILLVFALMVVIAFFSFSFFLQKSTGLQWYDKTYFVLFYSVVSAIIYMVIYYHLAKFAAKKRVFCQNNKLLGFALINFVIATLFFIFSILCYYGLRHIITQINSPIWRIALTDIYAILLGLLLAFSASVCLYSCVVLCFLIPSVIVSYMASPVKKPLWWIVIILFIAGGILQILHSLHS